MRRRRTATYLQSQATTYKKYSDGFSPLFTYKAKSNATPERRLGLAHTHRYTITILI